jgi:hypothetical protein
MNIMVTFHAKPRHIVRDEGLINSTIPLAPLPGTVKASCSREKGDHGSVYRVKLLILFARFESAHWDNNVWIESSTFGRRLT